MQPRSAVARQFGKAIRDLRLRRTLTQQQLADACGLDISYVGQIERGQRNPTLGVMQGLASVLGAKLSDVLRAARLSLRQSPNALERQNETRRATCQARGMPSAKLPEPKPARLGRSTAVVPLIVPGTP